jgi:inner membrane protein
MTPKKNNVLPPVPKSGTAFDLIGRLPKPSRPGVLLRLLAMLLILAPLWIAANLVNSVISEREGVRDAAEREISAKWGNDQVLAGPVLVVPWTDTERITVSENGKDVLRTVQRLRTAKFLPDAFKLQGELKPELRRRGIFETVLYIADLKVSGRFTAPDFKSLGIGDAQVHWNDAVLSVGVPDPRGIREGVDLQWGGQRLAFKPGAGDESPFAQGFHLRGLPVPGPGRPVEFSFNLQLNGSRTLLTVPVGRSNEVTIRSTWADPSFTGEYLPVEREVTPQGFNATWRVQELARTFPQAWREAQYPGDFLNSAGFGVGLVKPASTYQQSARATKYAILFLLLTFAFFFLFEVLGDLRVHPVQYLLVGAALVVFYLLLLSVSEHIGFNASYLVSTFATLGILWGYVSAVLKERKRAKLLIATLAGLYGYLFVILRLNDYALLMGTLGIFVALAALMYFTRNIDWYDLDKRKD